MGLLQHQRQMGAQIQDREGERTRERRQRTQSKQDDDAMYATGRNVESSTPTIDNVEVERARNAREATARQGARKYPYKDR